MAARTTAVLVCALGIALSANQQPSGQRPVFRAGSILVSVDAYPRKDGRVIEGLTKDDFEVFEDGKPQTIETFQFVRVDPVTPDADRRDPTSVADAERQAADPRNRLFVIFLDLFHVSFAGSNQAKAPILDFLHRTLAANDMFAVMTPEVPVSALTFARRTETIEQELTRYWIWGEDNNNVFPRNELERRLGGCDPNGALVLAHRAELTSWTMQQLVIRLGALRDERKNILLFTERWNTRRGASPGSGGGSRGTPPTIGVGPGGKLGIGANMSGDVDRSWCDAQMLRLRQVDYDQRFKDLLDLARRANVSFYPVDLARPAGRIVRRRQHAADPGRKHRRPRRRQHQRSRCGGPENHRRPVGSLSARLLLQQHRRRRSIPPNRGEAEAIGGHDQRPTAATWPRLRRCGRQRRSRRRDPPPDRRQSISNSDDWPEFAPTVGSILRRRRRPPRSP